MLGGEIKQCNIISLIPKGSLIENDSSISFCSSHLLNYLVSYMRRKLEAQMLMCAPIIVIT